MEHAKHIIRAVLLLAVAGVVFVLVRHFAIPESYGMHGAYRFDSVAEHSAKPPHHGAPGACAEEYRLLPGATRSGSWTVTPVRKAGG